MTADDRDALPLEPGLPVDDDWIDDYYFDSLEAEPDDEEDPGPGLSVQSLRADLGPEAHVRIGWRSIALVAVVGLAEAGCIVGTALLIRYAVDALMLGSGTGHQLVVVVGALVAIALFGAWVRGIEFSISESIGYRYVERLRLVMYAHLQRTSAREMLDTSRGGVLLRFTGDLTTLRTWVSRGIARGVVAGVTILAGLALLAFLDPIVALAVFAILGLGAYLSVVEGTKVRRATRRARRQRTNLTTNLAEQVQSVAVVQAMGRTKGEFGRFGRQNARLTTFLLRYARIRGWLRAVSTASGSLAVVAVLVVGVFRVSGGSTSVGEVVAAMLVARQLVRPVRMLGLSHDYWQSARVSREKVLRFLRRPYREADNAQLDELRVGGGRITFEDVYLEGSLRGVTVEAEPRQTVAMIGPNGCGKSSLLAIVARLADPDAGHVRIDGHSLSECTLRSCAARISMMGPALPLMRGTLRRNLTYRWRDAPEEELQRVVKLCEVDRVIDELPGGLDAQVKEGGANLSAGQTARVALARALLANPKILLLDEPTQSLDVEAKARIREVLSRYGGTLLIATHDPEEAALADVVWRMEAGRIAEVIAGEDFRASLTHTPALPAWAQTIGRP